MQPIDQLTVNVSTPLRYALKKRHRLATVTTDHGSTPTSPFEKGGSRGICFFVTTADKSPPPPFVKGGKFLHLALPRQRRGLVGSTRTGLGVFFNSLLGKL